MSERQWPTFDAEIVAERAACERLRGACERDPSRIPELAERLDRLEGFLFWATRFDEMLPVVEERLQLLRLLADRDRGAHRLDVAGALWIRADLLRDAGRVDEALAVAQEARRCFRELAQDEPDDERLTRRKFLLELRDFLLELDRRQDVVDVALELVHDQRRYHPERVPLVHGELAEALTTLADDLRRLHRLQDALAAVEEALGYDQAAPQVYAEAGRDRRAAMSLALRSSLLAELGRGPEAQASALAALTTLWPHFEARPRALGPSIAELLAQADLHGAPGSQPAESMRRFLAAYEQVVSAPDD